MRKNLVLNYYIYYPRLIYKFRKIFQTINEPENVRLLFSKNYFSLSNFAKQNLTGCHSEHIKYA